MIDSNPLLASLFAQNPALMGLIDTTANQLAPKSGKGATATATATAGGATATATATAGGATATADAGGSSRAGRTGRALGQMVGQAVGEQVKGAVSSFVTGFATGLLEGLGSAFCPDAPKPTDNNPFCSTGEKPGSLSVDSKTGTVTTAGGYQIEQCGQFEWKVKGPDGKETRVWGDPHVETKGKDGKIEEKWDFKKDATFVLPDGTKINVKCSPWGKDMTVTSQLEIIHGKDRVVVTDIDKGKGKVSEVSQGKEQFKTEQTFVAGKSVADWFFDAKEIKANIGGKADKYALDENSNHNDISQNAFLVGGYKGDRGNGAGMNELFYGAPLDTIRVGAQAAQAGKFDQVLNTVLGMLPTLTNLLGHLSQLGSHNPYTQPATEPAPPKALPYDPAQHQKGLSDALRALGSMFTVLASLMDLVQSLNVRRAPQGV